MNQSYFKKWNLLVGWGVFLIAATVYLLTMEPSASLWDCMEFIATSYKLEVGHPPGAPLFMMLARVFSLFAFGNTTYVPIMVNAMSALTSAFTILFLFWSITHIARKMYRCPSEYLSPTQTWTAIAAGAVGALAYTFTDTFWFSAVEAEVYALSSMFTAMVVWAMLRWEDVADEPRANRWLVLIAYLMGLSIGVHILNLLTIPALVFIYYFRKTNKVTPLGLAISTLVAFLILGAINGIIIPQTVAVGAAFDKVLVNGFGMPVNSGLLLWVILLAGGLGFGVWYTYKHGKVLLNTILLCLSVIMIGYSSYASVVIRASANPPMNSNNPSNPYALLKLLNRDQYGNRPLIYGPSYASEINWEDPYVMKTEHYLDDDGTYKSKRVIDDYNYQEGHKFFFPRMYSPSKEHIKVYKEWGDVEGKKIDAIVPKYNDYGEQRWVNTKVTVPTFGEHLQYFMSYQLNFMYWRYFMWNFVGRQSDVQSTGSLSDGNWISGIKAIDKNYLGNQDNLPSDIANNKGHNRYYFLPLILGIVGLVYQLGRDRRNFAVVMWLFIMMGIALVVYFNSTPNEPRERDYVYAGSFYAFCMWIGLGVMAVQHGVANLINRIKKQAPTQEHWASVAVATVLCMSVPTILAAENWDDHDRSGRTAGVDFGHNYMVGLLPNSIVMNYGDNDTFPLWYNQEVNGMRPDVRIMNMSYLGGDWYIDEMKLAYNESAPVPFSLPGKKYRATTNDYVRIVPLQDKMQAKDVVAFIASDDKSTRDLSAYGIEEPMDYIPTKRIIVPVNKENVLKTGIVPAKDSALIADNIVLNITKESIDKSELMLLDLLANFNWERPLFFTQSYALRTFGLQDYLQFDGAVYRLVPIKVSEEERDPLGSGRIDTEVLYDNLMNKYRWGGVSNPDVYVDSFIANSFMTTNGRNSHARLANALMAEGDTVRAIEVLDHAFEVLPQSQFRDTYITTTPSIEAYYKAGAFEKGDAILEHYADGLIEYIDYYENIGKGFSPHRAQELEKAVEPEMHEKVAELYELFTLTSEFERDRLYTKIGSVFMRDSMQIYFE